MQTLSEQIEQKLNAVTHGIGAGLAIAALIALMIAVEEPSLRLLLLLYGVSQIILYLSSALTHVFYDMEGPYGVLRVVDQAAVYLLIAGTYTPVALGAVGGVAGWWMFGLEWGMAVLGIAAKATLFRGPHLATDLLYLPMGWLLLLFLGPVRAAVPPGMLTWIIAGGLCYTGGILFYLIKRIPLGHVFWHLAVIAGGSCFFIAFWRYLV